MTGLEMKMRAIAAINTCGSHQALISAQPQALIWQSLGMGVHLNLRWSCHN